ncbi:helix-turn-helix domain-containing protein [Pseudonocardia humida]|uniref:Helix-turn-helix domain-containing protein n=1 Tax=Pseudonocardia humida TaxID=2800819 RepID=A0ABT1A517_9PSEU|nr:helix-turn-helix domain-containing protein [Pseudonocardia humida]MCO1658111.1 helix-turn-helix domain-containing protein [Pseudonocardia humida]
MEERPKIENGGEEPRFYSVAQAARLIGTAPVTLYRAIRDGEFPAIRIRGRLIVPAKAIEAMADAAVAAGGTVDLADADFVVVQRGAEG